MTKEKQKFERFYKLSKVLSVWQRILFVSIAVLFALAIIHFAFKDMKLYGLITGGIVFLECAFGAVVSHKLESNVYVEEDKCMLEEQNVATGELDEMVAEIQSKKDTASQEDVLLGYLTKYYFVLFGDFLSLMEKLNETSGSEVHDDAIESFLEKHSEIKEKLIKAFKSDSAASLLVETFYNTIDRRCYKLFEN